MNMKDSIVAMLKLKGMTQMDLAERLNLKCQSAVANALYRCNMEVGTLVKWCGACGYEVVIQPKNVRGKRPDGQFVIDSAGKTSADGEAESEKKTTRKKTSASSGSNGAE